MRTQKERECATDRERGQAGQIGQWALYISVIAANNGTASMLSSRAVSSRLSSDKTITKLEFHIVYIDMCIYIQHRLYLSVTCRSVPLICRRL